MHTPSSQPHSTALVLGGGGSTGNAWLIGIVAGLFDAGLDVTGADRTIGTSAGATAGGQLAGASPAELFRATLTPVPPQRTAAVGATAARPPVRGLDDHLDRMRGIIATSEDAADWRRRMGAAALEVDAASDGAQSARWRTTVAGRLPADRWPERMLLLTAVDARTGEPVVFDRDSGVGLADAVAASTSGGGFAYRIGEGRYIDGGYRSNAENADLAAGCERVLVLSPLGGRSLTPVEWGTHLTTQVDRLRAGGSRVETIVPDAAAEHLFGARAMDGTLRPAAAQAGYDQGRELVTRLADLWA
ncbi:patatin-like phospholipase family protein [Microbacterium terricola]|uniref:Phospholipase n=1 Tax=Microbacterium terricola TaxID=344163 RepID=A0ABM8E2F6_9MICO|nr:patatin-like phospholipase family protein [Microbacterium terricola]UYK40148.1 patatin-like phospholipase family protein [Microbacterium terricola]BDV32147.1 phospholipase [Microbacterium terricola]